MKKHFRSVLIVIVLLGIFAVHSCTKENTTHFFNDKNSSISDYEQYNIGKLHNEGCLVILEAVEKFKQKNDTLTIAQFDSIVCSIDTIYNLQFLNEIKEKIKEYCDIKLNYENALTEIYKRVLIEDTVICPITIKYFNLIDKSLVLYDKDQEIKAVINTLEEIQQNVIKNEDVSLENKILLYTTIDLAIHSIILWDSYPSTKLQDLPGTYWADVSYWVDCSAEGVMDGHSYNHIRKLCLSGSLEASVHYFFFGVETDPVW